MLDGINRNTTGALTTMARPSTGTLPGKGVTATQSSVVAVLSEESVTVSLSPNAITATLTSSTMVATASVTSDAGAGTGAAAEAEAQRGQEALKTIVEAKGKAAKAMKGFLRQKLEGYKKQLQIMRLLGTDALDIAKGAVRVARGVAGAAHDYAAATIDEKNAGMSESTSDSETAKQAQDGADALKARAAASPLTVDAASNNPSDAPTDPDERFFYDAYRIMGLARKTLVQAQDVDTRLHGNQHARDFKKLRQREGDMEKAVTESYVAMRTGGDLKAVDALLKDSDLNNSTLSTLA